MHTWLWTASQRSVDRLSLLVLKHYLSVHHMLVAPYACFVVLRLADLLPMFMLAILPPRSVTADRRRVCHEARRAVRSAMDWSRNQSRLYACMWVMIRWWGWVGKKALDLSLSFSSILLPLTLKSVHSDILTFYHQRLCQESLPYCSPVPSSSLYCIVYKKLTRL